MKTLRLKCKCGAQFEAPLNTYINPGGTADKQGRVFVMEVRADEWQDRHQACLANQMHNMAGATQN